MIKVKIKKYSGGEHEIYTSSHGEWERFIPDLREPLQMLASNSSLKDDKCFLTLITAELGYYIGVLKPLRGSQRPDDHLAGWLFIANDLQISGDEIYDRISMLQKELEKEVCDNDSINRTICNSNKNIKEKKYPDFLPQRKNLNKQYAYRLYGQGTKYSLREILSCLNQHYYQEYTAVFLLENKPELRIQGITDLTDRKFEEYLILFFNEIPPYCRVYINDTEIEKNKPFSLAKGESLSIKVRKSGFEDILHTYQSSELKDQEPIPLPKLSWRKRISKDFFTVIDSKGNNLNNYRIIINNNELSSRQDLLFPEEHCNKDILIDIKKEGYEIDENSGTGWIRLSNITSQTPHTIKVKKKKIEYNLHFPIFINGEERYATIGVEERGELRKSPIKGYKIDRRTNKYEYELSYSPLYPLKKLSNKIILIVSIILLLLVGYFGGNAIKNTFFPKVVNPPKTEDAQTNNDSNRNPNQGKEETTTPTEIGNPEYVDYLKKNNKWKKLKMEEFSEINGLWDDLNNRRFNVIFDKWNGLLANYNIPIWIQLIEKLEELKINEPNKYRNSQGNPYIQKPNDYDITIKTYMDNLISDAEEMSVNQKNRAVRRERENSQKESNNGIGSLED